MQFTTLLPSTSRRWLRLLFARIPDFDITPAGVVPLILVGRAGGGIAQIALAEQLGVVEPSLVRTLARLDEQGLLRREPDPNDRRVRTLWLTDVGEAMVEGLEKRLVEIRAELFEGISTDDLKAALRVHEALVDRLALLAPIRPGS
ncbi:MULTISPECIES: MarR family transcriptional regulator [Rhodanobacteraceae]|uniref:MarR family winged helix-turn-helix transcriptional regulator n=1 Tax=Rhodanobacteraceae TaxID=1775411 RepID=UPI0009CB80F2|nr:MULTISPECIES: MarR family transcriptional regulator [Rhodanobacteraceae]SKB26855.1 MarR family transcriptional regulator, transcriptional regulator for hemolysin [Luteibacter sp. 22Crub2.1]